MIEICNRPTDDIVKQALTEYESTRDDDRVLFYVVCMLKLNLTKEEMKNVTLRDVFIDKMDTYARYIPQPKTVERYRRLLQEENPRLRGEDYVKRQNYKTNIRGKFTKHNKF